MSDSYVPIIEFLESCYHPFSKNPSDPNYRFVVHEPWRSVLQAAFTPNEQLELPYTTVLLGNVKKAGKTQIAAGIGLWFATCLSEPNGEQVIVANKREQAKGRAFFQMQRAIENYPLIRRSCRKLETSLIETSNGTRIYPITTEAGGEAGANPELIMHDEAWALCLPLGPGHDLQVLTASGWKRAESVDLSDSLATLSADGGLEYQRPTRITRTRYVGEMVRFAHRRCNFLVTPNHRVHAAYADTGQDRSDRLNGRKPMRWECRPASEAVRAGFGWIKQDAEWAGQEMPQVSVAGLTFDGDDWMRLLGWFLAEGGTGGRSTTTRGDVRSSVLQIYQSESANPETFAEIGQLLSRMGLRPRRIRARAECRGWAVYSTPLATWFSALGLQLTRFIPREFLGASGRQLRLLLECYLKGDGWITDCKGWQCSTISRQLADDLLEVGLKAGFAPRLMGRRPVGQPTTCKGKPLVPQHGSYRLSFSNQRVAWERRLQPWSREAFDGEVWCPTVPNGVFYVRYNGYCFWTGNSGESDERLWSELTPVPTRRNSVRLVVSYAGWVGFSTILHRLYEHAMGGDPHPDFLHLVDAEGNPVVRVREDSRTFAYWETEQRMPWQLDEKGRRYYEDQRRTLRHSDFLRLHQNQWVANEEGLDMAHWRNCIDPAYEPPQADPGCYLAVGVDASYRKDTSAVMSVYRRGGKLHLGPYKIWQPRPEEKFDIESTIEAFILDLKRQFRLRDVYYDAYQFHRSAVTLEKKGVRMVEWTQTEPKTKQMGNTLTEVLKNKEIRLPDRADLNMQAGMTSLKLSADGVQLKKDNRNKKIDAIIALAMALIAGERLPDSDRSVGSSIMVLG